MRIFKTRQFDKWAAKEGISDDALVSAVSEMEDGLNDADLGGHVFKKRVPLQGRGKSGGARTLLAYRFGDRAFFVFGFAKNERSNIDDKELKALKRLASVYLGFKEMQLRQAVSEGVLVEVIQ